MFVYSTFLIYNSRWFWFLFSVTASVLYSVDDLPDPCEQNCPWQSKNWPWLPIWRSGFGFMFKFFSKLVMNGRRFKISIYSIKKVLNNDEILHHRTKSNSSGAFGLLGRVFHKNLKIFTDPDFSKNQVPDTVFHVLSIGHKIRAVRILWEKL